MITKKEYEQLLPYEADFRRAVKANYKLPTPTNENILVETILRKYEPKEQVNWSCPNCAFRCYKRVGWMFYAYKEWLEKQSKEEKPKKTKKADEVHNPERPEQDDKK